MFDGFDESALALEVAYSPSRLTSSSNVIYLRTVNTDFDAFRLNWRVENDSALSGNVSLTTKDCGQQHTLGPAGVVFIQSPGYPHGYEPNLYCEWIFKSSDPAYHVYVDVFNAVLEATASCQIDYLSIESSSNLLHWQEQTRVCNGSGLPLVRVHGAPYLKLKFKTDATINGTGFMAKVQRACGANMTGSVGTIKDTFLLEPQIEHSCMWNFEVRPGRQIDIQIDYEGPPKNTSCQRYGYVLDGVDEAAPRLGKFCNQLGLDRTFRTSGPHATIRYDFPSLLTDWHDELGSSGTWTLTYREYRDCDNEVRLTPQASNYTITTPGYPYYPHAHTDCTWTIIAPPGETIAANFLDFDLSVHQCDQEFVELYDGSTTISRPLLKTCRLPVTTHSTGNLMLVHYQTELSEPHSGFKLNVSVSKCGGQYVGRSGVITSENYPALGAYPTPAVCEHVIKVSKSYHLEVSVEDLHIPFNPDDSAPALDFVEFLDLKEQGRLLQVLYGNISSFPFVMTFQTSELGVRFVAATTSAHSFRGFKLKYESKLGSCYKEVKGSFGELHINADPDDIYSLRRCRWRITVPKGQRVRLELLNIPELTAGSAPMVFRNREHNIPFRVEGWPINRRKNFEFYNDVDELSKITEFNIAGYNGSNVIESSDNFMLVKIAQLLPRVKTRARFSSTAASLCPSDIGDQAFGTVSNLELNELSQYFCSVSFKAQQEETFVFAVQELPTNMEVGFVKMVDDAHYSSTFLRRPPNSTITLSTTNGHLDILKRKTEGTMPVRLTYRRYPCGGYLTLEEGTTIELPQLPAHVGTIECAWTLGNARGFMLDGNASLSDSCDREYLTIFSMDLESEMVKLCRGTTKMNTIVMSSRQVKVTYHATTYQSGGNSQFLLKATTPLATAGLNKMVQVEDYNSPRITVDKASYRNNIELSWEFYTRRGKSLRLQFEDRFFIEQAPNCTHDQLEVLSSTEADLWQTVATLCGRELPQTIWVQAKKLRVVFRTNGNVTGDGFSFVVNTSCDLRLRATNELQSTIINHPSRYRSIKCNIEISSDAQEQLLVSVKGINWRSWYCLYKGFQAYRLEGGQEQLIDSKLCPDFEVTGYGLIRLIQETSFATNYNLEYQSVGCGGNYTAPFTLRKLRQLTDHEEKDKNCVWHVLAPPQHAIFVVFKYLNLYQTDDCANENLTVYRGNGRSAEQRVSVLCGNRTQPFSIMIDSNEALFESHLLSHYGDTIFGDFMARVEFTPNCNEHLVLSEGNSRMSLVRHYQLNGTDQELHCYFQATAPPGYRLSIWLKQLQLQNVTRRCVNCSSLELIDGFNADSTTLGKFYSVVGNGSRLFSSSQDLIILLSATREAAKSVSFELVLEMTTTVCGQLEYNLQGNEVSNSIRLNILPFSLY